MSSNELKRSTPEQQGIPSSAIQQFVDAIEQSDQEVHSFMLVKHGYVIAEGWWSPYGKDIQHMLFSLSKSFTSTAIGMAVDDGLFTVDDTVLSFFPDDAPDKISDYLASMRVKHLLTMSTGHDIRTFDHMHSREDHNWAKGFFEVPIVHEPGTFFCYNTGATYMLSEIISRTTGENLMQYLTPRLFEPLGIKNAYWQMSPKGIPLGGIGLNLMTEDIARFGQLYLQKGLWQGKRLLSEAWVNEATSKQISNGSNPNSDWEQGYGYQFWRCRNGLYRGDGAFGQFCFVFDAYDTVLAMTSASSDMQVIMNLVWDILLPALQSDTPMQVGSDHRRLVQTLEHLALEPLQPQAISPLAKHVSGVNYAAKPNQLGINEFSLLFTESLCEFSFGDEIITAGYGEWIEGETGVFNEVWLTGKLPFVACGSWVSNTEYHMIVRLYKTPYIYTIQFQFNGNEVHVVFQINVSLMSTEPIHINAETLR